MLSKAFSDSALNTMPQNFITELPPAERSVRISNSGGNEKSKAFSSPIGSSILGILLDSSFCTDMLLFVTRLNASLTASRRRALLISSDSSTSDQTDGASAYCNWFSKLTDGTINACFWVRGERFRLVTGDVFAEVGRGTSVCSRSRDFDFVV